MWMEMNGLSLGLVQYWKVCVIVFFLKKNQQSLQTNTRVTAPYRHKRHVPLITPAPPCMSRHTSIHACTYSPYERNKPHHPLSFLLFFTFNPPINLCKFNHEKNSNGVFHQPFPFPFPQPLKTQTQTLLSFPNPQIQTLLHLLLHHSPAHISACRPFAGIPTLARLR